MFSSDNHFKQGATLVELFQRELLQRTLAGEVSLNAARICGANLAVLQLAVQHRALTPREAALQAWEALEFALKSCEIVGG